MTVKLRDVKTFQMFLMMSTQGVGCCLFEKTSTDFPHGGECLNLFTNEVEFHHWRYDEEAKALKNLYKQY